MQWSTWELSASSHPCRLPCSGSLHASISASSFSCWRTGLVAVNTLHRVTSIVCFSRYCGEQWCFGGTEFYLRPAMYCILFVVRSFLSIACFLSLFTVGCSYSCWSLQGGGTIAVWSVISSWLPRQGGYVCLSVDSGLETTVCKPNSSSLDMMDLQ